MVNLCNFRVFSVFLFIFSVRVTIRNYGQMVKFCLSINPEMLMTLVIIEA